MSKYQGQNVQSRPARAGDDNYDANQEQVVVTMPDGTKKTVKKSEVTE